MNVSWIVYETLYGLYNMRKDLHGWAKVNIEIEEKYI